MWNGGLPVGNIWRVSALNSADPLGQGLGECRFYGWVNATILLAKACIIGRPETSSPRSR